MPIFTVLAGPNGAGKTSIVDSLRDQGISFGPFVNPDIIAKTASFHSPLAAGRQALRQTLNNIDAEKDFSRETTLSSQEILKSMTLARDKGFSNRLIFVGADTVFQTGHRVAERVRLGGHDIPWDTQVRRFDRSLANAHKAALLCYEAIFFDNTGEKHVLVGQWTNEAFTLLPISPPDWMLRIRQDLVKATAKTNG